MHGGSAGGGMSGAAGQGMGQGAMGGMHGSSGMGSMDQSATTMTPAQRRQILRTTSMQDQKYQASARAMSKVQGDLSGMQSHGGAASAASNSSLGAGSGVNAQSGDNSSDDLSSDLQDLEQSNDDLASSLNSDQQVVVASKLKDLDKKTKEMQTLAQQLKTEMDNPQADPKTVRERMKKLDKLGKEIAKEQREVASALGITA
jgi:chromosome segregation ATPase